MKKLGADHPLTLATLDNLAGAYLSIGKTAEAVALYKQVRDARVKKLGADHPLTLVTMNNLANAYRAAGETAEAIALCEQMRDVCLKTLGADHPVTLTTLATLALAYQDAEKPEQALPLFQQAAVGIEKRHFVHPHAGQIVGALSDYHYWLMQYDEAEAWRRKCMAEVKKRSGADSLPYATEMAVLGMILLKQKKWTDAEAELRDCLAIREKQQPDDWTTFSAQSMLGEALNGQKKRAEAEPLLLSGYEGMKTRETTIPARARVLLTGAGERIVQLYEAWGKKEKAEEWRAKTRATSELPANPFAP